MREKIYMQMLEIAASDPGKPWSLEEIVNKLRTEHKYNFDEDRYLCYWYASHFDGNEPIAKNVHRTARNLIDVRYIDRRTRDQNKWTHIKMYLTKESYYNYLESVELKEARQASLKAQRSARTAIIIAIITLLISTGIQLYGILLE